MLKNDDLVADIRRLQKEYRLPVTYGQWIDETDDINNRKLTKNKRGENARDRMQMFKAIDELRAKHKIDDGWARYLRDHIIFTVPMTAPHPRDAILPIVHWDGKKNTYSAVIGPSVDMNDQKVIDDIKHIQQKAREFYGMDKCPDPIRDMSNPRQKDWTPVLRHRLLTGKTYQQIADDLDNNAKYVARKLQALEREL